MILQTGTTQVLTLPPTSHRLLTAGDLTSEVLVLPVLQSLLVASSGGAAQGAASCLLARMTPPAKVLPVLLQALEVRATMCDDESGGDSGLSTHAAHGRGVADPGP